LLITIIHKYFILLVIFRSSPSLLCSNIWRLHWRN